VADAPASDRTQPTLPPPPSPPAAVPGLAAELGRLGAAARKQRLAHLIRKLSASSNGQGPALTAGEVRELEAAGVGSEAAPGVARDTRALALALGCTARKVRYLCENGLPRNADGTYDVAACVAWRDAHARRRRPTMDAAERANTSYRVAKAAREQLALARDRGLVIERAAVERGRVARCLALRRRLEVLPRAAAPVLQGLDARAVEAWLDTWVRDTLIGYAGDPWPEAAGPAPAPLVPSDPPPSIPS